MPFKLHRRSTTRLVVIDTLTGAHWCTMLVSVIVVEGFLVHHPVCR